jgi:ATP-dependent DNA helicase RecG
MPYRITVNDGALDFILVFFRPAPEWLTKILPVGGTRVLCGKIEHYDGIAQMAHPEVFDPATEDTPDGFAPVYPGTAGLGQKVIAKAVKAALAQVPDLPEWQDAAWLAKRGWPSWNAAVAGLHAPDGVAALASDDPGRERLAYDELLSHQLALALVRAKRKRSKGRVSVGDGRLRAKVLGSLPFALTGAQERAIAVIAKDMETPEKMLRLLQGDVGAGKTLVAFMAMLIAVEAGGQAALMAPTEILARQHHAGLGALAEAAGVRLAILTGKDKAAQRRETQAALAAGEIDIVVGTHALFQKSVEFADLRMAVVDEQHRFGVDQRNELAEKGRGADILVMSATPIPRTLAMASYGDMDVSVLDEKPPGRQPIETRMVSLSRYDDVIASLKRAIDGGARAYWICPLVEESDALDVAAAEDRARVLRHAFGEDRVVMAHGRQAAGEKDASMEAFRTGAASVLVATTVVEVGVDVPEATIMVIEHAERFGLAQLHQLRGRVGRGAGKSSCVLLYQGPLGETARERLGVLRETEDGFRIAEEDLRLRGAGDLLGVKQAGLPRMRLADLEVHGELMAVARDDARLILTRDEDLASERGQALRVLLYLMERDGAVRYLKSA